MVNKIAMVGLLMCTSSAASAGLMTALAADSSETSLEDLGSSVLGAARLKFDGNSSSRTGYFCDFVDGEIYPARPQLGRRRK